jgi:hypothetical protein
MTLEQKSEENIALVSFCFNNQKFCTAAGGRAYYAVFQRLKYVLQTEGFDYNGFLASIHKDNRERPFSHGTITMAFSRHVATTRGSMTETQIAAALIPLQQLYKIRRKADYDDGEPMLPLELKKNFELAEQLLKFVDHLPIGRLTP